MSSSGPANRPPRPWCEERRRHLLHHGPNQPLLDDREGAWPSPVVTEQPAEPAQPERSPHRRWCGCQRRIGLTGGIASGKSTVGRLLADRHGLPVLDADLYAREALAPGSVASRAVLERYGPTVGARHGAADHDPLQDGTIDRAALGRIVFADGAERTWLEELVHPLVRRRFAAELERLAAAPVVVLMVPLLFEAGLEGLCSEVWLVDCEPQQQLQRLLARDDLSPAEALARLNAQWPLARKRPLAEVLIDNRASAEGLAPQLARALQHRIGPADSVP
jgi:dephospho-CoA kinase